MSERVAIVGSRKWNRPEEVFAVVRSLPQGTIIISGGASGVDCYAEIEAKLAGLAVEIIPVEKADWTKFGRAAGPIRNTEIVKRCDRLIAFWDGKSRGTADAIKKALAAGKPVDVRR